MRARIGRALPRSADLNPAERGLLAAAFLALGVLLIVAAANALLGVGGAGADPGMDDWLTWAIGTLVALIVCLRPLRIHVRRRSFALVAAGVTAYSIGDLVWATWLSRLAHPPVPSISDVLWLAFYPLAAAGIVGLTGIRGRNRPPAGVWLDGIVAGGGLAAIGAAIIVPTVLSRHGSAPTLAMDLTFPVGDLLLVGLVVGIIALRGWRIDRGWAGLGAAFVLLAAADLLDAVQATGSAGRPSAMTNLTYLLALSALAFAAWQVPPSRPEPKFASWSVLLVPSGFMFAALALLLFDHVHRLSALPFSLATVTMLAAIGRMVVAFRDARGLAEARRLAGTDDLTALPNRRRFMALTEEAIAASEASGRGLAVLMLDLDNFKQLNDTLGHHAGDELLRKIGPRLTHALRHLHTVGRLGGDEFAVLVYPAPGEAAIVEVAQAILGALREPFTVSELSLRVTGSLGIATFPDHARDAAELMRHADIAMYQAKTSRDRYDFYAHERDTHSLERLSLAAELAAALSGDGIEVHYQPKADARTRRIVGVEALVRWRRADGRLAPPSEFVGPAEHAGLSRELTRRVIELALAQARRWRDAGYELQMAVNTTVADLLDTTFPDEVWAALNRHGVPAEALILEVTESSVLADPDRISAVMQRLCELGVELSLDDFGTGYSSMAHLKALPVGELKIDRSFVSRMCSDTTDSAIVYALIQLARKLDIRLVAEGVEDRWTWDALRVLDCDLIQGYLISRPLPAADIEAQLESQSRQWLSTGLAHRHDQLNSQRRSIDRARIAV
ncbi:MAG TPA: bifunctional diguanylate cyclase/phosphodiesterase [Solirubrobacteraceae bacterium]|nr:bifunctional diguanylate cyclase/phosphodiesterase [Solirubrobacteraceae bacterium]